MNMLLYADIGNITVSPTLKLQDNKYQRDKLFIGNTTY